jgi:hypothetical protein
LSALGIGVGVGVGGIGVAVGVSVGGAGVAVGGTGVSVAVSVGGTGVAEGGTGVSVAGADVEVASATATRVGVAPQPLAKAISTTNPTAMTDLQTRYRWLLILYLLVGQIIVPRGQCLSG